MSAEIGDMSPTHVRCRTWRHAWDAYDVEVLPRKRGYIEWVRCVRCGTLRWYPLDRHGDLVGHSRYRYAPGYRRAKGVGRLGPAERAQLRLINMERGRRR